MKNDAPITEDLRLYISEDGTELYLIRGKLTLLFHGNGFLRMSKTELIRYAQTQLNEILGVTDNSSIGFSLYYI